MRLEDSACVTRGPIAGIVLARRPTCSPRRRISPLADASYRAAALAFAIDRVIAIEMRRRPKERQARGHASWRERLDVRRADRPAAARHRATALLGPLDHGR